MRGNFDWAKMANILSLFDGISCARVAVERAGIKVGRYFSSEIDKNAIAVTMRNYPDTMQVGDIRTVDGSKYPKIDILIGGSPCQDLSISKRNREGLSGKRSGLFWEYARILKEVKPKYFVLENVFSMSKESRDIITNELGVMPIMINASLVSAQNRKRLFWTNIPNVGLPADKKIFLSDILETDIGAPFIVKPKDGTVCWFSKKNDSNGTIRIGMINNGGQGERIYSIIGKSVSLSALGDGWGAKTGLYRVYGKIRQLTPVECERLQGLESNYTFGSSNNQRYKMIGNAFNADVMAHILRGI